MEVTSKQRLKIKVPSLNCVGTFLFLVLKTTIFEPEEHIILFTSITRINLLITPYSDFFTSFLIQNINIF